LVSTAGGAISVLLIDNIVERLLDTVVDGEGMANPMTVAGAVAVAAATRKVVDAIANFIIINVIIIIIVLWVVVTYQVECEKERERERGMMELIVVRTRLRRRRRRHGIFEWRLSGQRHPTRVRSYVRALRRMQYRR
jgi:large-conductance mechanosensitive channel